MLPDLHTDFSRGRSGGLVFSSLSEFCIVCCYRLVKGFGVVSKAEVDVFLELPCFFDDSVDVGNLISGSSARTKLYYMGFQAALVVKNTPVNAGDLRDGGSIPGSGRSSGGENGNPLQYFCLENPIDRGPRRATVHRVAHSCTWLKPLSMVEQ